VKEQDIISILAAVIYGGNMDYQLSLAVRDAREIYREVGKQVEVDLAERLRIVEEQWLNHHTNAKS
jgi:hypothetical protein